MPRTREVVVRVPGSKSEAIRALILGALARGTTRVADAPGSDDVKAVVGALRALGVRIEGRAGGGVLRVYGTAGRLPPGDRRLHLGGSATGLRMLACVAALREGRTILDGDASLRRRSAGSLAAPLRLLGVRARARRGRPPISVEGGPAGPAPGTLALVATETSQVASGLLLAGPLLSGGLRFRLFGTPVSGPYLEMTAAVLRRFGVRVRRAGRTWSVAAGVPRAATIRVEADWSSAAYPLVAATILGRRVRVPGLAARSLQADRAVLALLRKAGARCGADGRGAWCAGSGRVAPFRIDLGDSPDLAPAAAALALFAPGESRVTGAAHLRGKESDRIAACVAAVRALGGKAEERDDGFVVRGGTPRAGKVDPRGDHRIALAFGVAAAAIPGARVLDRGCVAKSWPTAWRDMAVLLRRGGLG
jgi:3-phosphoshikimate 1-carboxyvinyltransferase